MNEYLGNYYKELLNNLKSANKRLINNSILLTFIKLKSNDRNLILNKSALPRHQTKRDEHNLLLQRELIREADGKIDQHVITAKGIWEIEKEKKIINDSQILAFIEKEYFTFIGATRPLSDKEKMVLLSMVLTRVFSNEVAMHLTSDSVMDVWRDIFIIAHDFLRANNLVFSDSEHDLSQKEKGNAHPVFYRMVRLNNLPKSTHNIFKYANEKRKYYLDINADSTEGLRQISFIFRLIFEKVPDYELFCETLRLSNELAYTHATKVIDNAKYLNPKYDKLIEGALKYLVDQ
jgi:hypothetical protein